MCAYSVSGEYAMIKSAAAAGLVDRRAAMRPSIMSEGATMSAPARTWLTAILARQARVLSFRRLCRETRLSPDALIYPIFVDETLSGVRPIASLPGQNHYGLDSVCEAVEECLAHGVTHAILFGLGGPPRRSAPRCTGPGSC